MTARMPLKPATLPGLDDLIDTLGTGPARAILVTGKGGVGKTAIATQIALGLAQRGLPVHLSTTDPAGRLPELAGATPVADRQPYRPRGGDRRIHRGAATGWRRNCARRVSPNWPCSAHSAAYSHGHVGSTS